MFKTPYLHYILKSLSLPAKLSIKKWSDVEFVYFLDCSFTNYYKKGIIYKSKVIKNENINNS